MAEIVLGMGSSHGPLLSTPPEQWDLRAGADRANKNHWYRGKTYDYEALLKELGVSRFIPKPSGLSQFMEIGKILKDVLAVAKAS